MQCISGPVWMSFYLTCNQTVKYHITCYRSHEAAQLVTKIHCTFINGARLEGDIVHFLLKSYGWRLKGISPSYLHV